MAEKGSVRVSVSVTSKEIDDAIVAIAKKKIEGKCKVEGGVEISREATTNLNNQPSAVHATQYHAEVTFKF